MEVHFSQDHKVIGIQYTITALLFLLFGFSLMALMRWQLAFPMQPIPVIGGLLGAANAPGGIMLPEFYNQLGAMHGTIMVFLGVVPLAVGGFGNYVMPLQIGAPDMAFPKLNMASYWVFFIGGVVMLTSFFIPGGAAQSGWTSYPPLSVITATNGQTMWLSGMIFLITSSLLGSVNFIVTIIQLRAKGLHYFRLPFFVWAQFVTSFLLLLAFPPLEAAGVLQLMDKVAHTSFFLPSGLVVGNKVLAVAGGGNPLLWQHLFWFLAHPEVYVLILPAMGIVTEIIANNTRKPIWGYRMMVYAIIFLGLHVVHRLGASHVHDRHGHGHELVLPDDDDDHLDPVGDHPERLVPVALRRIDPVQHADAVRAGVPADVRHRRVDRPAAGPGAQRHPPARHVLRHRPLPLRGGAGDDLRADGGHLLLVPESHGTADERSAGEDSLLRVVRVHQRRVLSDVHPGAARREPPPL